MNINHIIIVNQYLEGSAETNRIMAYARAFAELGLTVSIVFHSCHGFEVENIENVNIHKLVTKAPYLFKYYKIAQVVKNLYLSQTIILEYSTSMLCGFLNKNKYNIFVEFTEIPLYGRPSTIGQKVKESIKRILAKKAKGILVISNSLKNYYLSKGFKNVKVVNMFVDVDRFKDVSPVVEKEKYITYCGTIDESKDGVDMLVEAFGLFHKNHSDFKLKIIGRVVNELFLERLNGIVRKWDVVDSVEFTGLIKAANMPPLLCGATILALARPNNVQAQYGFPTKLGEYLCTGKPVVVTNVGEINCFLKDKETCIFAEADNPSDFALKLSWVADHYDEALEIGRKGKELCQHEFSSTSQAEIALNFINDCLS